MDTSRLYLLITGMADDIVFQQDPQLGSGTITLRNAQLIIVGGVSLEKERTIQLIDISPEFEHAKKRFKRFYLNPAFFAGICAFGGWRLLARQDDLWIPAAGGVILLGLGLIFPFMMRFEPVELTRFRDKRGQILFELYRPLKAAHKYDEFLKALTSRMDWDRQVR